MEKKEERTSPTERTRNPWDRRKNIRKLKKLVGIGVGILAAVCYVKLPLVLDEIRNSRAHPVGVRIHLKSIPINCPKPWGSNPALCHGPTK